MTQTLPACDRVVTGDHADQSFAGEPTAAFAKMIAAARTADELREALQEAA